MCKLMIDRSISDVNECSSPIHRCKHSCVNTIGSYRCACHAGFTLKPDGMSCDPINACEERCGGGKCIVENSRQKCFCHIGYRKGPADLDECVNINECALRERNKCNATKCQDVDGSYKCVCTAGYALTPDGLACQGIFISKFLPAHIGSYLQGLLWSPKR